MIADRTMYIHHRQCTPQRQRAVQRIHVLYTTYMYYTPMGNPDLYRIQLELGQLHDMHDRQTHKGIDTGTVPCTVLLDKCKRHCGGKPGLTGMSRVAPSVYVVALCPFPCPP